MNDERTETLVDDEAGTEEKTQEPESLKATHLAIDIRVVTDLRKLLGVNHDYDTVAPLIYGLERGVPLNLGESN